MLTVALLPGRATAATFTPNTTADGNNGSCGAACTLRDAIIAANAGPGNEVSVPAGTYTINLGQLPISQTMTVAGASARTTTVTAGGTSRVFSVGSGFSATIRDLTITGGIAGPAAPGFAGEGGGILTDGGLHLLRSAVVGNAATFTGGGISAPFKGDSPGTRIEDSLIAGNTVTGGVGAGSGGGLNLFGNATVANSTITGNRTSNPGDNQGGGLTGGTQFNLGPPGPNSLTLLNTTVAGNTLAGAGGSSFGAGLSGDNLVAPLAPIAGPPTASRLNAKNTIIAGNTGGSSQNCGLVNVVGTTNNLTGDFSCAFTDAGSKQSTNPQLGPLANNGGMTNTLAIGDGSPALNTGTNSGCATADQRGTLRPQATTCDIGAFEAKAPDLVVEQRVAGKGKKKKKRGLATVAAKGGKRVVFVATVTNKGEQGAPGTELRVKPPKKSKVKLSGCDSVAKQKGKKGKGKGKKSDLKRKRKRGKGALICSLGNLGAAASRTVQIKIRPRGKGKVVSSVSVTSLVADADPATNSARTKVRVKPPKRRR